MDIQLKKGLLDICVLAALQRGDSYGYQIIKDISPVIEISESTLYPILKRLEKRDCLTMYSGEYEGRLRRYYKLTSEGGMKIKEFMDEWSAVIDVIDFIRGVKE
jgi:PadR family transcriptional regulator PadR